MTDAYRCEMCSFISATTDGCQVTARRVTFVRRSAADTTRRKGPSRSCRTSHTKVPNVARERPANCTMMHTNASHVRLWFCFVSDVNCFVVIIVYYVDIMLCRIISGNYPFLARVNEMNMLHLMKYANSWSAWFSIRCKTNDRQVYMNMMHSCLHTIDYIIKWQILVFDDH